MITLASLTVSLALLLILVYRHVNADVPRLASTKTWLAIAIIIWICGELVTFMGWSLLVARTVHAASMVLFAAIILVKGRKLLRSRRL